MKVLILANYAQGLLGFRRELVERLVSEGYEVVFCVPEERDDHSVAGLSGLGARYARAEHLDRRGNDGTVVFTFISRVLEQKGIEQFLNAAEAVSESHPVARFHVYGGRESGYSGRLDELVQAGVVQYHGKIDDVREAHKVSSCTVHPSYYPEGMSNVLLESCACARPIITTGRPGCGEVVDDGVNGFVVRERDSADLVEKIERFLAMSWVEREAMGLAGRAKVEREFDRQIVVARYMEEIEGVCHEDRLWMDTNK